MGIPVIPEGDILTVLKIWRFESRAVDVKIAVREIARGEVVGSKYGIPGDAATSPYNDALFVSITFWEGTVVLRLTTKPATQARVRVETIYK